VHEPGLTLRLGHGSCRDLALLTVEGVRALGFAARFVSGYLYVPTRDDPDIRGGECHPCLVPGLFAGRRLG
jgi:transglutaminase-like putative cysteine protease